MGIVGRQIELGAKLLDVGNVDLRLASDDYLLSGPVDARAIERLEVVDCCEIIGAQVMVPAGGGRVRGLVGRSTGCAARLQQRLHPEIVQTANSLHHRAKNLRQRRLRGVRKIGLTVDGVAMYLGSEGRRYLSSGAIERDPIARASYSGDMKPLLIEPLRDFADVIWAGAEAVGVFFRSEPVMVVRRCWILLCGE